MIYETSKELKSIRKQIRDKAESIKKELAEKAAA